MVGASILVVEDNAIVGADIEDRLKELGYTVPAVAFSGEEAIQRADKTRPDLILMDIRLRGDLDGVDAAEQIRARFDIPVVYLTAYADEETLQRAKVTEPYGYLLKPFGMRELSSAIEIALYKHKAEVERKGLTNALQRRSVQLQTAAEVSRAASSILDLDELIQQVVHLVHERFDLYYVGLFLIDRTGVGEDAPDKWLMLRAGTGEAGQKMVAQGYGVEIADHSAVGRCVVNGQACIALDVGEEATRFENPLLPETRSEMALPLISRGQAIGALNIHATQEAAFGAEHIAAFQTMADQLANAIENARLYEQAQLEIAERKQLEETLRRRVNEQTALYTIASATSTLLAPEKLLSTTLDVVIRVLNADAGWVALPSTTPEAPLFIAAWQGIPESFMAAASSAALRTCPICVSRLESGDLLPESIPFIECPHPSCEALAGANLHSHIGIPLSVGAGEVLGVLNIAWRDPSPESKVDWSLLTAIGQQVGLALRNVQLYQEARQVDRLAILNAIGAAAVSSLKADVVLHQVMSLTCQALHAAGGSVLLRKPETNELFSAITFGDETHSPLGKRPTPGRNIADWVVQRGEAVCVNDVKQDPRWHNGTDGTNDFEHRSLLCAPLVYHGKIVGAIEFVNKLTGEFNGEDLSLLEAVASIAAAALENASLYAATRMRAEELTLLNEIGLALSSSLDASIVAHAALSQVQRLLQAKGVLLLEPDPETGELRFARALFNAKPIEIPIRLAPGEGISGWVLDHRQPVLVEDAQKDPRFSNRMDQCLNYQVRAMMAVPLQARKRIIGVIAVIDGEPGIYTNDELRTLQAVASMLAAALENAHLYGELEALLREREQAQAQLIQTEKMAALGRLVTALAHEINNPLQALRSGFRLLLSRQAEEEKQRRYLEVASGEVERLIGIVERVLNFYRPANEQMEPTDINAVLEATLLLVSKTLEHSRVTVRREFASDLSPVEAIADQLRQVFLNIILNAQQAMPSGGHLTVKTGMSNQGQEVCIVFTDTGRGIHEDEMARLFEPFFTTRPDGTGMGLAISYGIVERHGGRIEVKSEVGKGSAFTVVLPVQRDVSPSVEAR